MIEVITDRGIAHREAMKYDPELRRAVSLYYARSNFWRWVEEGRDVGARLVLKRLNFMHKWR